MAKLIIPFILFLYSCNLCQGQIFTDTIFSGKTRLVDLSNSKCSVLGDAFQEMSLCPNLPNRTDFDTHKKANVPFLLQYYSKRAMNDSRLMEFDAIIYTAICGFDDFMRETYIFEIFFENDIKAKAYVKSLDRLNKFFEYAKKHDVVESKDELVSVLIAHDFFYKRKANIIYLFHKNLPINDEVTPKQALKLKFFEQVDILYDNKNE